MWHDAAKTAGDEDQEGRRILTTRGTSIRVISARDMSHRERTVYEQAIESQ